MHQASASQKSCGSSLVGKLIKPCSTRRSTSSICSKGKIRTIASPICSTTISSPSLTFFSYKQRFCCNSLMLIVCMCLETSVTYYYKSYSVGPNCEWSSADSRTAVYQQQMPAAVGLTEVEPIFRRHNGRRANRRRRRAAFRGRNRRSTRC